MWFILSGLAAATPDTQVIGVGDAIVVESRALVLDFTTDDDGIRSRLIPTETEPAGFGDGYIVLESSIAALVVPVDPTTTLTELSARVASSSLGWTAAIEADVDGYRLVIGAPPR
jgi:hypothetical protein